VITSPIGPNDAAKALMRTTQDIMSTAVCTVTPDMRLARAAELLAENQVSGAPVCDRDGRVIGILSESDLTDAFAGRHERTVADVMTPEVLSVRSDQPIGQAIRTMAFEGVHRLVVLDEKGLLRGIVTSMDILRELAGFEREDRRGTSVAPPEERGRGA
jgi:predicted transcriptional regulator